MTIALSSSAFQPGERIPKKYTGEGEDVSPPLQWKNVPDGTKEFALICDDPDAPSSQPWVHWVIYGIPAEVSELPESIPGREELSEPIRAKQGTNSWPSGRTIGYRGPMPPPGDGIHHYHFHLYALDRPLELEPGAGKQSLLQAIKGHVIAEGKLIGTYSR